MTELHRSFDEVAELYDAARPTYPAELVEAVSGVLRGTQKRILEIGCGTGQATLPFAREGCRVTALEPGERLALLAAKNLAAFPQVSIQTSTFEQWPALEGQYDLVMSATAFHWIAPEVRYIKSAQALTDKGWLALFWNSEAGDESAAGQQIQAAYEKHMPFNPAHPYATHHPNGNNQQQGKGLSRWQQEIDQSHLFGGVSTMQFPWTKWYTTEQYLQLLETYADHRALPPENKCRLFDEIAEVLAKNGGGHSKLYLTTLYLAQVQKI
jgi:SAM-dependent methyltransferase